MFKRRYLLLPLLCTPLYLQAQYAPGVPPVSKIKQQSMVNEISAAKAKAYAIADRALVEKPQPVAVISSEGRLQGDPVKTETQLALRDFNKCYALAISYQFKKDKAYLDKACAFLIAWARENSSRGNPIDDTNYDPAIATYRLLKPTINPSDNLLISNWLRRIAEEEIRSVPKNQKRGTAFNNWHSHRLKVIGEIGFAIGDGRLQNFAVEGLKKQLAVNLLPEGQSVDFQIRDALHYQVYDIEPLLQLAIIIREAGGQDFFHYKSATGSSLEKSLTWLAPYLKGDKQHQEYIGSKVDFDRRRAENGEAGFQKGTLFDPFSGLKTLALAGYFDPVYDDLYIAVKANRKGDRSSYETDLIILCRAALANGA